MCTGCMEIVFHDGDTTQEEEYIYISRQFQVETRRMKEPINLTTNDAYASHSEMAPAVNVCYKTLCSFR